MKIEAKTEGQKTYIEAIRKNKIVFCEGPAGSGKTIIPSIIALELFQAKKYERIIISRPLVQSDNDTGFLPGDLNEKMDPYVRPIMDIFSNCLGKGNLEKYIQNKQIEIAPLGYIRGRTFENSFILFDEMQNATREQIVLALTRFGKNSKMVFTGDSSQTDLRADETGYLNILDKLDDIGGLEIVRLTLEDIVREPIIRKILERL